MQTARLRGTAAGLLIDLSMAASPEEAQQLLRAFLHERIPFLEGAAVGLDCGSIELSTDAILALVNVCHENGLRVISFHSTNNVTAALAQELGFGLPTTERSLGPAVSVQPRAARLVQEVRCGLVHGTLRGGQYVQFAGSVIVFGDVNPGAEIIADADVVVWGSLRGTVHAGATGRRESVVCALRLVPTQLRIADCIARAPDEPSIDHGPEMAMLQDGRIVVHSWPGYYSSPVGHVLEESKWNWIRGLTRKLRRSGLKGR